MHLAADPRLPERNSGHPCDRNISIWVLPTGYYLMSGLCSASTRIPSSGFNYLLPARTSTVFSVRSSTILVYHWSRQMPLRLYPRSCECSLDCVPRHSDVYPQSWIESTFVNIQQPHARFVTLTRTLTEAFEAWDAGPSCCRHEDHCSSSASFFFLFLFGS
ncbi:hypothetical protein BDW22DRAFT_1039869 [Trametopsis cervina]|nr:hypothetical protein BDW22DRAFT_1039869 [Trametopsis cervina]